MMFIPRANYHTFSSGQRMLHPMVESRMVLMTLEGEGRFGINGILYRQVPGNLYLLPWNHRIDYRADANTSLRIACIHIIPEFSERPPQYDISHDGNSHLHRSPYRSDDRSRLPETVVFPPALSGSAINNLIHYIIRKFTPGEMGEAKNGILAELLAAELRDHAATGESSARQPLVLRTLTGEALNRLRKDISVEDLAAWGGCSRSTVFRLFRQYYKRTPNAWLTDLRMEKAGELLATTSLSIKEIAAACGYTDPHYFSRSFRKATGISPTAYRCRKAVIY